MHPYRAIFLEPFSPVGSGEHLPVGESWNQPRLASRYHFEHMQHPEGMPHVGPGIDGKRTASCKLEMFCTLKKAEGVFFSQRYD